MDQQANDPQRMEWNVRDSGGTVIFSLTPTLTGGSKKTVAFAITLQLARAVSDSALSDQLLKAGSSRVRRSGRP